MKNLFVFLLVCTGYSCAAQETEDYYNPRILSYEDKTYVPYIRTVILEKADTPMSFPYLVFGSEDKMQLSFDLLEEDIRDYSYKIIHCTPQWTPSILSENDYIEGFYTDQLSDYKHSLNTIQPYWHYRLEFPNAQMKPLISGNYLLVVFENSNPDSIILSRRFWVTEQRVEFKANIHRSTLIELRNSHQEADFTLFLRGLPVTNPYADIQVQVLQNRDPNFALNNLKPVIANGESIDYNHDDINSLEGGSEYRNFDIRSTRFQTQFVERFYNDTISGITNVVLKPEIRRNTMRYVSENDLNGNYLIKIYEGREAELEGDYVWVHFRLKSAEDFTDLPLYIEGAMTEFGIRSLYRMNYTTETGCFEKSLLLKQGYYNYRYVTVDKDGKCSQLDTEGSHYETLNDYYFLAWWKEPGKRYERLIGIFQTNAGGF